MLHRASSVASRALGAAAATRALSVSAPAASAAAVARVRYPAPAFAGKAVAGGTSWWSLGGWGRGWVGWEKEDGREGERKG